MKPINGDEESFIMDSLYISVNQMDLRSKVMDHSCGDMEKVLTHSSSLVKICIDLLTSLKNLLITFMQLLLCMRWDIILVLDSLNPLDVTIVTHEIL